MKKAHIYTWFLIFSHKLFIRNTTTLRNYLPKRTNIWQKINSYKVTNTFTIPRYTEDFYPRSALVSNWIAFCSTVLPKTLLRPMSHKITVERKTRRYIKLVNVPLPPFFKIEMSRREKGSLGIVLIVINRYLYQLTYNITSCQQQKSKNG